MVRLPVVSLFPFLSDILAVLRGEEIQNRSVAELMGRNGLIEGGRPTKAGERILQMLEQVGPPPDSDLASQAKKIVYEDKNQGKHPGLKEYLERLRQVSYVKEICTFYYNPDLPEHNRFKPGALPIATRERLSLRMAVLVAQRFAREEPAIGLNELAVSPASQDSNETRDS